MEYRLGMNREYGAKWFVFYAKVRPWLVCLGFLTTVADFWQYTDVYFEYWWLMLYFLGAIVQVAFSVTVCKQSSDTYPRFVKFVKGVLAYETIFMPYII